MNRFFAKTAGTARKMPVVLGLGEQDILDAYKAANPPRGFPCLVELDPSDVRENGCIAWGPRYTRGPMSTDVKSLQDDGHVVAFWTMDEEANATEQWVDLGPYGGPAVATGSLRAWGVLVGPAFDFWHTRVKAGIGAYDVIVHASVFHDEIRPSELDLGYMFAVTYFPLLVPTGKRDFKVGLEARLGLVTEAALNYVSFGATITEDAIAW